MVIMLKKIIATFGLAALFTVSLMNPSLAQEAAEHGLFWDYLMQDAASPSAERIHEFHNMLVYIITGITLFVLLLLIIVVLRFNKRANPTPSKTSHNVLLEVLWTALPVVILIIIAIPSFKLLYYVDRTENPEMTLKVTGYQWHWGYEYPEHGDISFMSYMVQDDDIDTEKGQLRLLSTDNPVVLPVNKNIQIDITAAHVLHSWAVPALGVKKDAVPGRLNSTWFRITEPGTYYGQCSELCGKYHAYMPIEIKAVSQEEFEEWVLAQGGTIPESSPAADNHSESTDSIESGDVSESSLEQNTEEADTESEGDE